jgi:hypothetical protein
MPGHVQATPEYSYLRAFANHELCRTPLNGLQATPEYSYLRANPHRINLGRVFLRRVGGGTTSRGAGNGVGDGEGGGVDGGGGGGGGGGGSTTPIAASDLSAISQTLHLWNGSLASAFTLDGEVVTVTTAVHPDIDVLAVRVCAAQIATGRLGLGLAFPYPTTQFAGGTDWNRPAQHSSAVVEGEPNVLNITMDTTTYYVHLGMNTKTTARQTRF